MIVSNRLLVGCERRSSGASRHQLEARKRICRTCQLDASINDKVQFHVSAIRSVPHRPQLHCCIADIAGALSSFAVSLTPFHARIHRLTLQCVTAVTAVLTVIVLPLAVSALRPALLPLPVHATGHTYMVDEVNVYNGVQPMLDKYSAAGWEPVTAWSRSPNLIEVMFKK